MKILITAGPTRENLDPVRFISNPSTGKMGYLIAQEGKKRGYKIILITGPTHLKPPDGIKVVKVISAEEMKEAVLKYFPECDALIMAAAVSDWKPQIKYRKKLKRKKEWNLKLIPNPDILKEVSKIKKENQIVIGFTLWFYAINKIKTIIAGILQFFAPLTTGIIAVIWFGEKISFFIYIGGFLTILGVLVSIKSMKN